MKTIRRIFIYLVFGMTLTVFTSWVCAMWSPAREAFHDQDVSSLPADTAQISHSWKVFEGVGWLDAHRVDIIRYDDGRYVRADNFAVFPTIYRAGWPFPAVESRINLVGSEEAPPQPRRWDLPMGQILHRGTQTNDLPAWTGAISNRRLPLIPVWPGFWLNSVMWTVVCVVTQHVSRTLIRSIRSKQGGFPVLIKPGTK